MVPEVPDSAVDLARRVAELEAENRRLRQLLGFDGRSSVAPTWEPTLFTGQTEAAGREVNPRSPPKQILKCPRVPRQCTDSVRSARQA
jgi:hypothetical protein